MKSNSVSFFTSVRQTAAEVLAAAAVNLYPETLLFQGQGTGKLFFYDFFFPFPFQNEFLVQLEERMRQILKQGIPIKVLDMMPGNAASLFDHVDQPILADKMKDVKRALVQVVQIGEGFADWCQEPLVDEWDPSYAFKLLEFYPIQIGDDQIIRIIGFLEEDKQGLKEAVKKAPSYAEVDHLRRVESEGLFAPMPDLGDGLWAWLPKANQIKNVLIHWWHEEHSKQNFDLMTTPACLHVAQEEDPGFYLFQAHRDQWQKRGGGPSWKVAEISYLSSFEDKDLKNGLFESVGWIADRAHLFVRDEELFQECISSLQFITKIPKILGFEFQIILYTGSDGNPKKDSKGARGYRLFLEVLKKSGLGFIAVQDPILEQQSRIQVQIADALGRWWDGPFIEIDGSLDVKSGYACLTRSAFNSLERLVALCLENCQGNWPFWLHPEQVRILLLSEDCKEEGQKLQRKCNQSGLRATCDAGSEPLKVRLKQALMHKVPFVVIFGEKELKSGAISYRTPGSSHEEKMGVNEFINMMMELNGSKDSELEN